MMTEKNLKLDQYWKANLRLVLRLLSVWFLASYGCGILFVEFLDQYTFFGFKLGFWFAQQGSIFIFVILIFIYIYQMKKLDRIFKTQKKEEN